MKKPRSIEGIIKSLDRSQVTIEKDGLVLINNIVSYICEAWPYQGFFLFYGPLGGEVIGRKFEFNERYPPNENFPPVNDFPAVQFLRVWNGDGTGCRDYHFVDKRRW